MHAALLSSPTHLRIERYGIAIWGLLEMMIQLCTPFHHQQEYQQVKMLAGENVERTMVSVLCGQRDRFRKRVTELEEEVDQVIHTKRLHM